MKKYKFLHPNDETIHVYELESPDGEWVKAVDAIQLEAELDHARELLKSRSDTYNQAIEQNAILRRGLVEARGRLAGLVEAIGWATSPHADEDQQEEGWVKARRIMNSTAPAIAVVDVKTCTGCGALDPGTTCCDSPIEHTNCCGAEPDALADATAIILTREQGE